MIVQENTFTVEDKKKLETVLVERILNALETERITMQEMKEYSGYILDEIAQVKNGVDLASFLNNLSQKCPIFTDVANMYKTQIIETREKEVIGKLSSYLKTLN